MVACFCKLKKWRDYHDYNNLLVTDKIVRLTVTQYRNAANCASDVKASVIFFFPCLANKVYVQLVSCNKLDCQGEKLI